jgi:hypothetical protein
MANRRQFLFALIIMCQIRALKYAPTADTCVLLAVLVSLLILGLIGDFGPLQ